MSSEGLTEVLWEFGLRVFGLIRPLAFGFAISIRLANRFVFFDVLAMQSHEVLREVFQECSPKQVAAELGLSLSMIYKWAEPPDPTAGSGSTNPLDRIDALLHCTKNLKLVQWICQRAGGFFILNPKTTKPHPSFLIPATNQIVQEFADLLAVVASAAADNQITQKEAQQIRARWEELKAVTETFVACCEEGSFQPLKDKGPDVLKNLNVKRDA